MLAILLLLTMPILTHTTCSTPILGENLWRLSAAIGSCLDLLDNTCGSFVSLTQANFNTSPLVINEPGYYKLCESVSSASFFTVEISSSDVVFDFNGNSMTNIGVSIGNGVVLENVIVQNGFMNNAPNFITIVAADNGTTQNIVVQDLILDTVVDVGGAQTAIKASLNSNTAFLSGLTIRNISIYNGAPNNIAIEGNNLLFSPVISEVVLENIRLIDFNPAFTVNPGVDKAVYFFACINVVVNNLVVESLAPGVNGVWIDNIFDIFVTNTKIVSTQALLGTPYGFYIASSGPVTFDRCFVDGGDYGFQSGIFVPRGNFQDHVYNNCFIANVAGDGLMALSVIAVNNCETDDCGGNGFNLAACVGNNLFAQNNFDNGFLLTDGCQISNAIASTSSNNGFSFGFGNTLVNSQSTSNEVAGYAMPEGSGVQNILINALSTFNLTDGFTVIGGNNVISDSIAFGNVNYGFNIQSNNVIENCCSEFNTDGGSYGCVVNGSNNSFKNFIAHANNNDGFLVAGTDNLFIECTSMANHTDGFNITGDGNSCNSCTAVDNGSQGFHVSVTNGCFITQSAANTNGANGFLIENILAEASFTDVPAPIPGTWNIGAFTPVLSSTTDCKVRLSNNTALQNTNSAYEMSGSVLDVASVQPAQAFMDAIYPTIGVINTIQGGVATNANPIPGTVIGVPSNVPGVIANVVSGNLAG